MNRRLAGAAPWLVVVTVSALLYLIAGCSNDNSNDNAAVNEATPTSEAANDAAIAETSEVLLPPEGNPALLSAWGQLDVVNDQLVLADDVVPYGLNSALFSDYAHKLRTVWLPAGVDPAVYRPDDVFDFPVGTVITKTFYFPVDASDSIQGSDRVLKVAATDRLEMPLDLTGLRLIETRILVHRADGWQALPYVWNDDQTDASLARTGDLVALTLVDGDTDTEFPYLVPDVNQCANCHATNHTTGVIQPIGPKARHLNGDVDFGDGPVSQLVQWQARGLLTDAPGGSEIPQSADWSDQSESVDDRARAYLDINCSHCHNRSGSADTSALYLEPATDLGPDLGVCKAPIAAGTGTGGRLVGIDPGSPEDSIFVYRLETTDPASMMPELGRALAHTEGVDLISAWIESLTGSC